MSWFRDRITFFFCTSESRDLRKGTQEHLDVPGHPLSRLVFVASRLYLTLDAEVPHPLLDPVAAIKLIWLVITIIFYTCASYPILDAIEDIYRLSYKTCIDVGKCKIQLPKRC